MGDRGELAPPSSKKPKLVANPATRKVAIVDGQSPLRVMDGWLIG